MSATPTRHSEAMRAALIEKAEQIFAEHGMDTVSVRQIGRMIGSANDNVIGYYFGSKRALVQAVFDHRLPALEARRASLLMQAKAAGSDRDLATLIEILARPLFEQVDVEGRRSYARFLAQVRSGGEIGIRQEMQGQFPATDETLARVISLLPSDRHALAIRLRALLEILTVSLAHMDDHIDRADPEQSEQAFADTLRVMTAALSTPHSE